MSADTVISSYANPQNLNRFSYTLNNPLRYTDPSGHIVVEDTGGGWGGVNCNRYPQYCHKDGSRKTSDELKKDRENKNAPEANAVETMATVLDTVAVGLNGGYAIIGDIVGLVCQECYPFVVGTYQYYSFLPNSVSTLAMVLWVADGVDSGKNSLTFTPTSTGTNISLSISQDTIVAVGTNIAGWTVLREPNAAFFVDAGVASYDYSRIGMMPLINYPLPATINPTITYNTEAGLEFSWHK